MSHPTADDIRKALLKRAETHRKRAKKSWSRMGLEAVNDSKFFMRIKDGKNFSVETYERVMRWLDEVEREVAA